MSELPEATRRSVAGNIEQWTKVNAEYGDASAAQTWANDEISWGMFGVTEESIGSPLGDVAGQDILDLGCGTGYFSAWLAVRGGRPVGLDPTPAQLQTARRIQAETGIEFPLVEGVGEAMPFPDDSFDIVLSEYGASLWADPFAWIPEAARVLRLRRSTDLPLAVPAGLPLRRPTSGAVSERLHRPLFGMHHITWPGESGMEYNLAHGDWVRLLRANEFEILDLIELQVPEDAETHAYYDDITAEWGRKWPPEEIWVARLRDERRRAKPAAKRRRPRAPARRPARLHGCAAPSVGQRHAPRRLRPRPASQARPCCAARPCRTRRRNEDGPG